jgi:hypothetical protein
MKIIEMLWEAIAGDPPRPPSVADYCAVEQERINLETERDAYRRELLRLGYRADRLDAMARGPQVVRGAA